MTLRYGTCVGRGAPSGVPLVPLVAITIRVGSLLTMAKQSELPEMVTELVDMSKTYIRQETIEPAKKLGRTAGISLAGAFVLAIGAVFLVASIFGVLQQVAFTSHNEWFDILSRFLAFVLAALGVGLIAWRMSSRG